MEKLLPSRLLKEISIFAQIIIVCPIAFTQPVNDDCTSAIEILVGKDEATATRVNGDTRGATASALPTSVCSGTFYTDDVWFRFSTVDTLPTTGIVIRVYLTVQKSQLTFHISAWPFIIAVIHWPYPYVVFLILIQASILQKYMCLA